MIEDVDSENDEKVTKHKDEGGAEAMQVE